MISPSPISLPIEAILAGPVPVPPPGVEMGRSRDGRPIFGHAFGHGPMTVSLIAGCHADEPVGPAMLERVLTHLATRPADDPLLNAATWRIVAHANPDGEVRNRAWTTTTVAARRPGDASRTAVAASVDPPCVGYDLGRYLRHVRREAPGDDVEFGFPRTLEPNDDPEARPENRAIAAFLRLRTPIDLHASFHGMAFAAGPWFLLERAWIDRTASLRQQVRARVRALGYRLHDIDRHGDKGFDRIDEGFTTRPDSRAMAAHFQARDDHVMAARFRPNSMEFARRLGGDPLTLVSEMPLFLLDPTHYRAEPLRPAVIGELQRLAHVGDTEALAEAARAAGATAMPIDDQMRLQLAYLNAALDAVQTSASP